MNNFGERIGYDGFTVMEERTEQSRREMGEQYLDEIRETELNKFAERVADSQAMRNLSNELFSELTDESKELPEEKSPPGELKEDHFEASEGKERFIAESLSENHVEEPSMKELPERISENVIDLPVEGVEQSDVELKVIAKNRSELKQAPMNDENGWDEIYEGDLPAASFLKPINKMEELFKEIGIETDEEREAYWYYIYQCMNKEHKIIMDIPMPENTEFWPPVETDESLSFAFSSMDYQRRNPFDRYHWRVKKVYEKVKDLGITYSSVSHEEGKNNTYQRYRNLVQNEFRDRADFLLETYKKYPQWMDRQKLFDTVADLNSKIRKCNEIWDEYSTWD